MNNSTARKTAVHDVLIVDDEAPLLKSLAKGLSEIRPGLNVVTSGNGKHALEAIQTAEFDLVITDLRMPVMDGFAFLEGLRQLVRAKQPRIIVMSILNDLETLQKLTFLGVEQILEKPLDFSKLIGAIDGRGQVS